MALERQRALGLRRVASVGRPGAVGEDQDRPDVYLGGIRFP